jgi:hypothetical protein
MGIGSEPCAKKKFCVPLRRLTLDTVKDIFMVIEEPDDPLVFTTRLTATEPEFHTIGDFYRAVLALIEALSPDIFSKDHSRQVTGWVGTDRLHAVVDLKTASRAINLIIDQGEGTTTTPASGPDELAHYYRFEQIQRGESLDVDPAAEHGYAWGPPVIPLVDAGVWPMTPNPPDVTLPKGSEVAQVSDQFDATFTTLVDELQATFTGEPARLGSAMAQMHALRLAAQRLMPLAVPGTEETAGPRFLYAGRLPERDVDCS